MSFSPLHPYLDEKVEKLYVQPKMTIMQVEKKVANPNDLKGKEVLTYQDVFGIGNLTNIYIQGNPGMGKSTYCAKLTLDWCNYVTDNRDSLEKQESKAFAGLNFEFLFLISLRVSSKNDCEVFQMVKQAIISQLWFRKKYDDSFLSEVLDKERCLIILDGLDEWAHSKNVSCKKPSEDIPHRCALSRCVYLTLTRPWKLNQICLKDSEIDVLLEISGVREPCVLITKVISSLNSIEEKSRDVSMFAAATRHLSGLTSIPIISMLLVCLWFNNETLPESQCGIYCKTVKMMMKRNKTDNLSEKQCLAGTMPNCFSRMKWFESEKNFLKHLGKLAFETLFPEDGQSSQVVFSDETVRHLLEDKIKMTALSSGLLTEYKIRSLIEKSSQLSFLHKTIQEFLAAFYLSLQFEQYKELVSRVKLQGGNINDISQLFIFLCGMAPKLATSVSHVLMAATTRSLKEAQYNKFYKPATLTEFKTDYFAKNTVKNITEIINAGYRECKQNGHDNVCLKITHLYFDKDDKENKIYRPKEKLLQQNLDQTKTIWCNHPDFYQTVLGILKFTSKTITTICLPYVDNSVDLKLCHCLKAFTIPSSRYNTSRPAVCLDMSRCRLLEHLHIYQSNLALNINTDQLQYCFLLWCDLSQGNIVETLTKRNSKLRYLYLAGWKFPRVKSGDKSLHLDMSSGSSLERLEIINCDISVSINTTNLWWCRLWNIDLSQGNLLETLSNSTQFRGLSLWSCSFPLSKERHENKVCIDMSACTNLRRIKVKDSDVIVKFNNVVVGKDQTLWEKR